MTCQELLALSGALSAALPTGQSALSSLLKALSKTGGASVTSIVQNVSRNTASAHSNVGINNNYNNNRTTPAKRHTLVSRVCFAPPSPLPWPTDTNTYD